MKKISNIEEIWDEQNINTKKEMIRKAINEFDYPKKAPSFIRQVNASCTTLQLDQIALNIYMAGEKLNNIKI